MTYGGRESAERDRAHTPVFLCGCGRSGTTLLRLMLNAHPDLAIPLESHFMYQIARLRAAGKWPANLEGASGLRRFRQYLEGHYYFSLWKLDHEALWRRIEGLPDRSHASVFEAVFTQFMIEQGKRRWGDKTPRQVLYLQLVERLYPGAKFVQVVRDARDVALSLRGARWGPRYIALSGYYWKWAVLSGKLGGAVLGPSQYREVRYEDLVTDPEPILRSLSEWLELPYDPSMLEYHETSAAAEYASQSQASRRVSRPPDRRRVARWESEMSTRDERSIVRQSGALLALLGYPVDRLPSRQSTELDRLEAITQRLESPARDTPGEPRAGREATVRLMLRLDRAAQMVAFARGDYRRWLARDTRWQQTVARMLR